MKLVLGVLAVTVSCLAGSAMAADTASGVNQGFYLGLDVGKSFAKFSNDVTDKVNAGFANTWGGSFESMSKKLILDKSNFSYNVFGGYTFDQNWAVEFGYQTFGKPKALSFATKTTPGAIVPRWTLGTPATPEIPATDTTPKVDATPGTPPVAMAPGIVPPVVNNYKVSSVSKVSDMYAAVVGRMPIYPGIDVYGKLGAAYVTDDVQQRMYVTSGAAKEVMSSETSKKQRKLSALVGVGVSYDVGSNASLRLEYRYIPKAFKSECVLKSIQSLTLGLAFSF